jgi:hypothetical protein
MASAEFRESTGTAASSGRSVSIEARPACSEESNKDAMKFFAF